MRIPFPKHYLYRHIRLDKNEPFYIGVGTIQDISNSLHSIYKRANDMVGRGKIWHDIKKKTEIEVEILFEGNDYRWLKLKEIEFIALYGRIDKGTGILANLTDGGEGECGAIRSEELRERISNALKGRKLSPETLAKRKLLIGKIKKSEKFCREISERNKKSIVKFSPDFSNFEEWDSLQAAEVQGYSAPKISNCCKDKRPLHQGFKWMYKEDFNEKLQELYDSSYKLSQYEELQSFYI